MRIADSSGLEQARPELFEYRADDFPDAAALIDAIAKERRVELAFEGNYFHDLIRLPIPQRELDVNPNLVQNPG